MFASILFPEKLEPIELDNFLANGWYRMGQGIFTTHFLCFKNNFYSAIWLRVSLADAPDDAKFKQLQKQNRQFRTEIKKANITSQHEALYKNYKQGIAFEPTETLQMLLYGYTTMNRFDTYEVNVYNGSTLIAAGFFDLGKYSAAGIVSFYHPDYKKHSLGKYLIYLKIDYCKKQELTYFYPGYVAPGYPSFDYKLSIGKFNLEYFAAGTRKWLPYTPFTTDTDPLKLMCKKLAALQSALKIKNITSQLLHYRFFDANLDPHYSGSALFDYPVFLYCFPSSGNTTFRLVVFDICSDLYSLVQCSSVIQTDWFKTNPDIFSNHLLQTDKILYGTSNQEEMVTELLAYKTINRLHKHNPNLLP